MDLRDWISIKLLAFPYRHKDENIYFADFWLSFKDDLTKGKDARSSTFFVETIQLFIELSAKNHFIS